MSKTAGMSLLATTLLAAAVMVSETTPARADKTAPADTKTVTLEGKTVCAHCEYGMDDIGCATALKDEKSGLVYILQGEGDAFRKFLQEVMDAPIKVTGTKDKEGTANSVKYVVLKVTKFEVAKKG